MFGGEPLLYIDKIEYLINSLKNNKDVSFVICTNGILLSKYIKNLIQLKDILGSNKINKRFHVVVSYDYYLQNNRSPNTYDIVRNNIKLLYNNDFFVATNTIFDITDINSIHKCFLDFIKLYKECPDLLICYNFNYFSNITVDEKDIENVFKLCNYSLKKTNSTTNIIYNRISSKKYNLIHKMNNDCLHSDLYCGVDTNGDITFGCNVNRTEDKKMLYMGNIQHNSFEEIQTLKQNLLNKINYTLPEKCKNCTYICKYFPWFNKGFSLETFMSPFDDKQCLIQKYITEYLIFSER